MKKIGILLAFFLASATGWTATTYYVSTSGDNSNNGTTTSTPWATVAKVNGTSFTAGDSILFKAGDEWTSGTMQLVVPSSGSSGNPITFGSYGAGAKPKITNTTPSNARKASIICLNRSWIVIDGFDVGVAEGESSSARGIILEGGGDNIVQNCTVTGSDPDDTTRGILVFSSPRYTIQANTISLTMYGIEINLTSTTFSGLILGNVIHDLNASATEEWDAIKINGTGPGQDCTGTRVAYNELYAFNEDGIDCFYPENVIFEYNYIHDSDDSKSATNQTGIKSRGQGCVMRYNRIINVAGGDGTDQQGIVAYGPDAQVYYNLIVGAGENGIITDENTGEVVINNTIVDCNVALKAQNGGNATFRNNIVSGATHDIRVEDATTAVIGGYNVLINEAAASVQAGGASYSGGAFDKGATDPLFTNAGAGDYTLRLHSPAIGMGAPSQYSIDLAGHAVANPPSMGAYEWMGVSGQGGNNIARGGGGRGMRQVGFYISEDMAAVVLRGR